MQRSRTSLATLSGELGINLKTVAQWRERTTVKDLKTRPKAPRSTTLTEAEEAMMVAFRHHTLLPLDDRLYAMQPSIRTFAGRRRTAASSRTASPGYRMSKATSPSDNTSSVIPSTSST